MVVSIIFLGVLYVVVITCYDDNWPSLATQQQNKTKKLKMHMNCKHVFSDAFRNLADLYKEFRVNILLLKLDLPVVSASNNPRFILLPPPILKQTMVQGVLLLFWFAPFVFLIDLFNIV